MLKEGTVPVEVVALTPYQYKNGAGADAPVTAQKKTTTRDSVAASADQPTKNLEDNYQALNETMQPLLGQTDNSSAALVQREMDLGTFFIQVGAFSNRQSAEQLQQRLSNSLGRQTHISEHQGLFRVRIGPLTDHAELAPLKEQIVAMGLEQPRVIY